MFDDPVIEQFRLNPNDKGYSGVFTLAYPSKSICIILGFTNSLPIRVSQIKKLIQHVKGRGRNKIIFYRELNGKEIEKRFKL